ncbi:MAG TPA: hypothetical protein VGB17_12620 [Pyrinomonadaceae bacterium]
MRKVFMLLPIFLLASLMAGCFSGSAPPANSNSSQSAPASGSGTKSSQPSDGATNTGSTANNANANKAAPPTGIKPPQRNNQ